MRARDAVRVTTKFRDFFKHWVTDPTHPYKINLGQLVTLAVFQFWKKYHIATDDEKKEMFEELRKLKHEAEERGFLKNSREINENESE